MKNFGFGFLLFLTSIQIFAEVLAEGKSSNIQGAFIEAGWRLYSVETSKAICEETRKPKYFEVEPAGLRLNIGEVWHPNKLVVNAFGPDNQFIPSVPLTVSITDSSDATDTTGSEGFVKAIREGSLTIIVSWLCGMQPVKEINMVISGE
ncbi:hypothetical protein ACCI51_09400 [Microbulbifer echini]|uniref:Uncharacterized protein n=1 Tax=Microbulbifer echini TaxID=1529067 RepID=A0ABV4NNX1_9GAMM